MNKRSLNLSDESMKTSIKVLLLAALAVGSLTSCFVPLPPPGPHIGVGLGYYSVLPRGYVGDSYWYGGRYYYGGAYQRGRYFYNGRHYDSRYYHGGHYYYGGRHEHHGHH